MNPRAGRSEQARQRFERIHDELGLVTGIDHQPPTNESGAIAWGTAWVMHGYLLMFETTGDPMYLHRLARTADWILEVRDCDRGVRDHRGHSSPAWSSTGAFTVATATVPGADGEIALRVRLCPPGAASAVVDVRPGSTPDTVTLTVTAAAGAQDVLADVSLDPGHPRYATRVAYRSYPARTRTTVEVPLSGQGHQPQPLPGRYRCRPARVTLAAQTGMIVHPIAGLVRSVRENPELAGAPLVARAEHYLDQVTSALAVHEDQWRLDDEGRGYYTWLRDEPVSFAGVELPTNEFLAVGRAHAQIAAVTADGPHRERAAAMARTLRGQLLRSRGKTTWSYWPDFGHVYRGWAKTGSEATDVSPFRPQFAATPKFEDVTHALVDLDFACSYFRASWLPPVFTAADMAGLAGTYMRLVAIRRPFGLAATGPAAIRRDVSGLGGEGSTSQQAQAPGWLPLSPWRPGIRRHVQRLTLDVERQGHGTPAHGVDAYCAALLNRWA